MQALAVGSGPGVEEDKAGVRWGVCGGGGNWGSAGLTRPLLQRDYFSSSLQIFRNGIFKNLILLK